MIIANGYIKYVLAGNDGGIDTTTGYAIAASATLSDPVPCQYYPNSLNYISKDENGEPVIKQIYTVLLEQSSGVPQSDHVHLYASDNTEVGEFPVISITPLDAVCQYKMTL